MLQEVRWLAVSPCHRARQVVRVLEVVVLVVRVAAREIAALLEGLLAQSPAELHTLFGRHPGKGPARRDLVTFFRELRGHLAIAANGFFFGDVIVGSSPIVALREVPVILPTVAGQVARKSILILSCASVGNGVPGTRRG